MAQFETVDLPKTPEVRVPGPASDDPQTQTRKRWWIWGLIIVLAAAGIWYFRTRGIQASNPGGAAARVPGGPGVGMGTLPDQPLPVVVATARKGDLPLYFNGLGTVTAFNTVTVRSRVDGQIVKINFTEGQYVKEGDSLIEIDPRPYQVQREQAEGQLAKDQAQLKDATVNYERYQLLFKEGVIPKQQLDTQQATVGQFEGAIKADVAQIDNAKLQITYAHITAPISGHVGLRLVDIGNIVHASDTNGLVVITQLQPIAVLFSLPQDQLPQVIARMRTGAPMITEAYDRDNSEKIATGKLLTIDNQIDTTTGTYKLKAVFDNAKSELFPNQFVNMHLLVDTEKNVVIVPTTAVLRGPKGAYVFAVSGDNTVKMHDVTLTHATGDVTGISRGLASGEVVVVDGQDKLQDGSKVEPRTSRVGGAAAVSSTPSDNPSAASSAGRPAR